MELNRLVEQFLKKYPSGVYRLDEPMSAHTTLKIGGPAAVMFFPENTEEMACILDLCSEHGVRTFILGNGSNVLFSDDKLEIAVIGTERMNGIRVERETVTAYSGALLSKIAGAALNDSLTGFEFAHGIPGTLGGAVFMNAGAYGGEMKDVIKSVTALDKNGEIRTFTNEECEFSYRSSVFSGEDYVILSAEIQLKKGDRTEILSQMEELARRRREKQPLNLPSAGSTFKRPETGYAAAMIEEAGLKGFTIGGAQVSEKHSGFVVNCGGATFSDFVGVMEHVKKTVFEKTGVMLQPEVKIIV